LEFVPESRDSQLKDPVELHCLGGFTMTMAYGVSRATADIDILAVGPSETLARLEKLAGKGSKLQSEFKIYIQPVAIVTYPEDYASRLKRMWPDFKPRKLKLYALEPHDLALTKLERNSDVDRQDVLDLAAAGFLNAKTLRELPEGVSAEPRFRRGEARSDSQPLD
jgi:hypothetical protein